MKLTDEEVWQRVRAFAQDAQHKRASSSKSYGQAASGLMLRFE
jgi:hypothetical protein